MQARKFALSPYYEILEDIQKFQKLVVNDDASLDIKGRTICGQLVEFVINNKQNILLSESKRQKAPNLDIRVIIRFCKVGGSNYVDPGPIVTDNFPLHLQLDLNGTIISLPNFLPNDRCGKDGRRFPRPIDITEGLIMSPAFVNRMLINWVHDNTNTGDYYFSIFFVRLRSWEELTNHLLGNYVSAVTTTLGLIYGQCVSSNGIVDEELLLVDSLITASLCCPLSRGRMTVPMRGKECTHLQCFDGMTYLVMNFKKPTWLCPVCDKLTLFSSLEIDGLLYNILKDERSKSVDSVQFNKSGQWRPERKIPGQKDDDQPFFEITDYFRHTQPTQNIEPPPTTRPEEVLVQIKEEKTVPHLLISSKTQATIQREKQNPVSSPVHSYSADLDYISHNLDNSNISSSKSQDNTIQRLEKIIESLPTAISDQNSDYIYNTHSLPTMPDKDPIPPMTLRITDVKSMAPQKIAADSIAVLDEDMKDYHQMTNNPVDISKMAQKRPTMVSSVPTEVGSTKQMKFTDNFGTQSSRPHSAFVTDPRLQALSKLCNCTPERLCPFHNSCAAGFLQQIPPFIGYNPMVGSTQYGGIYPQSSMQQTVPQQALQNKKSQSGAMSSNVAAASIQSQSPFTSQYPSNITPQSYLQTYGQQLPQRSGTLSSQSPMFVPNYQSIVQYPAGYYTTNGSSIPNQGLQTNNGLNTYNVTCKNTSTEISVTHDPSSFNPKEVYPQTATYSYHPGLSPQIGTYPSPQTGTYPSPQTGTYPSPQTGTYPSPQTGTYTSPQTGTYPSPQTGTYPFPQAGTYPSPQSGTYPFPQAGTYHSPQGYPSQVFQGFPNSGHPASTQKILNQPPNVTNQKFINNPKNSVQRPDINQSIANVPQQRNPQSELNKNRNKTRLTQEEKHLILTNYKGGMSKSGIGKIVNRGKSIINSFLKDQEEYNRKNHSNKSQALEERSKQTPLSATSKGERNLFEVIRQTSNVYHSKMATYGTCPPPLSLSSEIGNILYPPPPQVHQAPQDHHSINNYPLSQKQWQQMMAISRSPYINTADTAFSYGSSDYLTSDSSSPLSSYNSLSNIYNG